MMVVICPAEAEFVLTGLLNLPRAIPPLPIIAFFCENHMACEVAAHQVHEALQQCKGVSETRSVIRENAGAGFPNFVGLEEALSFLSF